MFYSYFAYGLKIASDRSLPGLTESRFHHIPSQIDLSLFLTGEPDWLARAKHLPAGQRLVRGGGDDQRDPGFVLTALGVDEYFRLDYEDGTRFVVDHAASQLWGHCEAPLTIEDLATYLVGPVLGLVLRRRGVLALHASSVAIAGRAFVLAGPSEAGKSTTAGALALLGESVLGEDISPLAEADGRYYVEPGYPRVCLWPDSVEKLLGTANALPLLTPNWEKRYLPLNGGRGKFAAERLPLGAIYLLGPRATQRDAPRIEPLGPREALLGLVQNTYMNYVLDRLQRAAEFDALASLVERVPVRRITPHSDPARLSALCDLLLADAHQLPDKMLLTATARGR